MVAAVAAAAVVAKNVRLFMVVSLARHFDVLNLQGALADSAQLFRRLQGDTIAPVDSLDRAVGTQPRHDLVNRVP